jgi:hypothetical protein
MALEIELARRLRFYSRKIHKRIKPIVDREIQEVIFLLSFDMH